MNDQRDEPHLEEEAVHHLVPADGPTGQVAVMDASLAVSLTRAEIDQQIATAKQFPRSVKTAIDAMVTMTTMDAEMAEECIYGVPRGGKTIRGPSIRFAEAIAQAWGNCRDAARVTHVDRIERYVEAEGAYHDLQTNRATVSRVKQTIELKKNKKTIDLDMIQLAGAAAMAKARRNAILGGVPKPVWKRAYDAVQAVIRGDVKTLAERRDRAIAYFAKSGVAKERLLKALEIPAVDDISLDHLETMQGWRTAIASGEASLDEIFPEERPPAQKEDKLKRAAEPLTDAAASRNAAAEQEAGAAVEASSSSPATPPASDSPQEAVGGLFPPAEPQTPGRPEKAAGAVPRGMAKASARLVTLMAQGDAAALRGRAAVEEWLDGLPGDDAALIGAAYQRRFRDAAGDRP